MAEWNASNKRSIVYTVSVICFLLTLYHCCVLDQNRVNHVDEIFQMDLILVVQSFLAISAIDSAIPHANYPKSVERANATFDQELR